MLALTAGFASTYIGRRTFFASPVQVFRSIMTCLLERSYRLLSLSQAHECVFEASAHHINDITIIYNQGALVNGAQNLLFLQDYGEAGEY